MTTNHDRPPSEGAASTHQATARGGSRLGLLVLVLGAFVTVFDTFVVNVAIPSIRAAFAADFAGIGFVVAAYELGFGGFLMVAGRLGDAYGHRRMFTLGIAAFAATSALCGLAPTLAVLIVGRFLQGISAAVFFPQVYALIRATYDDNGRNRAFALLGMALGFAAIAGQVFGGFLVDFDLFGLGWRTIFLVNLPLGVAVILASGSLPRSRARVAVHMDWPGALAGTAALTLMLATLLEGPSAGWPAWTGMTLAAGCALFTGLLWWERRVAGCGGQPLLDLGLFRQRHFRLGVMVVLMVYATATAFFLGFAVFVQSGLGLSPFQAGCTLAPASVGFIGASLMAPRLVRRFGSRVLAVGACGYAAGMALLLLTANAVPPALGAMTYIPSLVVLGIGQGLAMTPLLNFVLGAVEGSKAGMAAGVVSTVQKVGGAFGVAIAGVFLGPLMHESAGKIDVANLVAAHVETFSGVMLATMVLALVASFLVAQAARPRPTVAARETVGETP
ncbi:MFS transporter [Arhodomonas sp. AD133]|uniref:MFS transporter n=1 Tax=Arhodomonas sp. AD133 TaxID=3415009 RepID=UPI003EBD62BF